LGDENLETRRKGKQARSGIHSKEG